MDQNVKILTKIAVYAIIVSCLVSFSAKAEKIRYEYNYKGERVPVSIGDEKIKYGHDIHGNYVPVSVGKKKIRYEYDYKGKRVPVELEGHD